jgi:hypothetical protein
MKIVLAKPTVGVQHFRKKLTHVEAIQLTWANWGAVCDFVPNSAFVRGTWLDEDGKPLPEDKYRFGENNDDIGLVLRRDAGEFLVRGNDWILKWDDGWISSIEPAKFAEMFDATDEPAPHHEFELRITISASTWEYARRASQDIADYIAERDPEQVGLSSGGWDGAHSIDLSRRDITPEKYREELEQWRQRLVATRRSDR